MSQNKGKLALSHSKNRKTRLGEVEELVQQYMKPRGSPHSLPRAAYPRRNWIQG